ncbi:hypothetical protein Trco_003959 [Trichoderma cornu-damae]|uniref:Uncharacterized protein n=1 Tax=Trichoderma cornu-damae TaxID=654480 RepID=A0A9P8QJS1_9HYPO|nr:hypothetical protein Trco_003959 [Trichoderma cornu-damae]
MDEKHRPQAANPPRRPSAVLFQGRPLLVVALLLFVGFHIWSNSVAVPFLPQQAADVLLPAAHDDDGTPKGLVPLEAHIISKCPDTRHGPSECIGNIIELCARELYPDPKINLGFIMCLTKDYPHIPDRTLIEDCALEHAIDFTKLNECAARDDTAYGIELLRNSVQRSADANVTVSCTIRLNDEIYCIRDDGKWKDCPHGPGVNDLVLAIQKLYRGSS